MDVIVIHAGTYRIMYVQIILLQNVYFVQKYTHHINHI